MLAAGMTVWLSFQALVNVGGVLGVIPITGIALPFVSFGSTAMVVAMAAVGVLVNITRGSAGYDLSVAAAGTGAMCSRAGCG
jgi:cell division protein FtsW